MLAESGPDVLALETVPDIDEAEALMAAIAGLGIPAWLSYSIVGMRTCAGQPLHFDRQDHLDVANANRNLDLS